MFALKIKTSVSTLQGVDNASRGDIRRKWRNEAVVPPPAPAHASPFSHPMEIISSIHSISIPWWWIQARINNLSSGYLSMLVRKLAKIITRNEKFERHFYNGTWGFHLKRNFNSSIFVLIKKNCFCKVWLRILIKKLLILSNLDVIFQT